MKSWYKVVKDRELKDGGFLRVDSITFETTDKELSKSVEEFFKHLMDTPQTESQTMSDLIRREDAIKAIEKHCFFINNQCKYPSEGCVEVIEDAINVPSADRPQGEWIPCSERLPDEDGEYLISLAFAWGNEVEVGEFINGEWYNDNRHVNVAWMPLPEPYKEGE